MRTRIWRRVLGIGIAAGAIVGLTAAPGYARTEVEKIAITYQYFYDNVVTGTGQPQLLLMAGGDFAAFCEMAEPPVTNYVRLKGDPPAVGSEQNERFVTRAEMALYDNEGLDAFVFLDTYCPAYFATGAEPEPIALGAGLVQSRVHVEFNDPAGPPDVWARNTAQGTLKTADGETLVVRGVAELTLSPVFTVDHVSAEIINR